MAARGGVVEEVGFVPALQGVRGLAVLWVIAFHYIALRAPDADPWIAALGALGPLDRLARHGYLGVDLFFLLSGFLLALPWLARAARGAPAPGAAAFYGRRVRRIVPAYYVQLAALFLVVLPLLEGPRYWARDLYVFAWNAVAHGLFLHTTSPLTSASMGVNGALWTLAVEAQFYVLLPWIAGAFVRRPAATVAALFALALWWRSAAALGLDALVAAQVALGSHWGWSEQVVRRVLAIQLPAYLGHFALGMALASAWLAWRRRAPAPRAIPWAAGAAGAGLVAGALFAAQAPLGAHTWLMTTAGLGALLWGAATGAGPVAGALSRGLLAATGRASYSAYLYHVPLLLVIEARAAHLPAALVLPLYALSLVLLAALSWRFVERPFISPASATPR